MASHRPGTSLAVTWAAAALVFAAAAPLLLAAPDPLEPASTGGLQALDRTLARLTTHKRLLVLAAHPDDEDTRLLTYVARGLGGEAAYLALSRGDGGQNLIGPELGVGLGLLRSRELLAARRIDGARQFFTRAYDFGYTRSLEETLERWPREVLLEDAVRVIRLFQPQVLVAVFPPSSRAGHGQHWASGVVAPEAMDLAADAEAFPALGLAPHEVQAFYRAAFFDRASATLEVPLGTIEPFSGRSIFQISMASRSQHRCQDMGLVLPLGDATGALTWQKGGDGAGSADVFSGVDTRLRAIAAPLPPSLREGVAERLDRIEALARAARKNLSAVDSASAVAPLREIVRLLREAEAELSGGEDPVRRQVRSLITEKLELAHEGLANAAGVVADAYTEQETAVPGGSFAAHSVFWNAGPEEISDLVVSVRSAAGWRETGRGKGEEEPSFFSTRVNDEQVITVELPEGSPPTVPYFLRHPLLGDLYDWSDATDEERGRPFGPPPLVLRFAFRVGGAPVVLDREVVYRVRDQARGEVRRPLRAVPRLEVTVEPDLIVWPIGKEAETLEVEVRSNADAAVAAQLEVRVPDGWPAVETVALEVPPHGRRVTQVVLRPAAEVREGRYEVAVAATTADGERFDHSYPLVDYEHIRPTPMLRPARVTVSAAEIAFPKLGRLGYVRGAADRVPEFLRAVGLPVEVLTDAELTRSDLSVYDTIVIGSRAYETDAPALEEAHPRLLAYVQDGGTLVVQYQQYQFVRGGYAPFALDIRRPHDRVTDETAPVRLLAPEHPALTVPNRITAADWDGWVQERGLYFAGSWGEQATPLLAMADPGDEEEKTGSLLVARYGKGYYVYTGLAFFRQLPAGVPGAYRLFVNLLALGSDD